MTLPMRGSPIPRMLAKQGSSSPSNSTSEKVKNHYTCMKPTVFLEPGHPLCFCVAKVNKKKCSPIPPLRFLCITEYPSFSVMCIMPLATCFIPSAVAHGPTLIPVNVTRVSFLLSSFRVVASWTRCATVAAESGQAPTWSREAPTKRPS